MFTLGVTVGAYWEIFEWFFVGKYTMADTISDLLVDGGAPAALVALALRRSGSVSRRVPSARVPKKSLLGTLVYESPKLTERPRSPSVPC